MFLRRVVFTGVLAAASLTAVSAATKPAVYDHGPSDAFDGQDCSVKEFGRDARWCDGKSDDLLICWDLDGSDKWLAVNSCKGMGQTCREHYDDETNEVVWGNAHCAP